MKRIANCVENGTCAYAHKYLDKKVFIKTCGTLSKRVLTSVMEKVVYLSLVTSSISFTITETKLLLPVREWVKGKNSFFGKLISCGYCFSYWIAFAVVAVFQPKLFDSWWILDYFLAAIVIAWISSFQWAVMCWLIEKAGK